MKNALLSNSSSFEKKIFSSLKQILAFSDEAKILNLRIGLAISGGADSLSLLLSIASLFEKKNLSVITVNHGIRKAEESDGDALFVKDLCEKLGVKCKIFEIESGLIEKKAREQKKSVEEIARKLRYEAFDSFISEENLDFLCLAHNQNDQLETVLMRFLQGSGAEGLGGIKNKREKYIRPLLTVSRAEIEDYLTEKKQKWRTDATNFDTKYLRNRIRNTLIPILDENFAGWQKAVLGGAKKSAQDEDFFKTKIERISTEKNPYPKIFCDEGRTFAELEDFYELHTAIARRAFFWALNKIGFGERFPFHLAEKILSWTGEKENFLSFGNLKFSRKNKNLLISFDKNKKENAKTADYSESGFFFILEKCGDTAETDDFVAVVGENDEICFKAKNAGFVDFSVSPHLPVLIRSYIEGDEIKTADGKSKSISKIFSDWKIPEKLRKKIPIIEKISPCAEISAVIAGIFGYKNWIVKTSQDKKSDI